MIPSTYSLTNMLTRPSLLTTPSPMTNFINRIRLLWDLFLSMGQWQGIPSWWVKVLRLYWTEISLLVCNLVSWFDEYSGSSACSGRWIWYLTTPWYIMTVKAEHIGWCQGRYLMSAGSLTTPWYLTTPKAERVARCHASFTTDHTFWWLKTLGC